MSGSPGDHDQRQQAWAAMRARPEVAIALEYLRANAEAHLEQQIAIAQVAAPGWHEAERAALMRRAFRRVGLADVDIDPAGNVLGWRHGERPGTLVVAAHLDTVFPAGTDVTVKRAGTRLTGPGLADDSRGLACLLALAEALDAGGIRTNHTVLFVADVGEEGLGNLRGIKYLFNESRHRERLEAFISIDGTDGFTITNGAVGSRRYKVTVSGPGGHSYIDFGLVNPVHAIGRIIARLAAAEVPALPKTTYSVGLVGGGTTINAIPSEAWLQVDLRSEGVEELARLDRVFLDAVGSGVADETALRAPSASQLACDVKLLGERPAGATPPELPIVQAAWWATREVGLEPVLDSGSTDAGAPTALGIPAICIGGGGTAGDLHSLSEWFDPTDAYKGVQRALLIILAHDLALSTTQEV